MEKDADASRKRAVGKAIARFVKFLVAATLLVVGLAIAAWGILGVTILPVLPIDGKFWAVKWAAWPQGSAPVGVTAVLSDIPAKRDMPSRLMMLLGGEGNTSIQQIIAGPGGTFEVSEDLRVFHDGVFTGYYGVTPTDSEVLGGRYLALCITGSCIPGKVTPMPVENLVGEPLGYLQMGFGLGAVPSPLPPSSLPLPPPPVSADDSDTSRSSRVASGAVDENAGGEGTAGSQRVSSDAGE